MPARRASSFCATLLLSALGGCATPDGRECPGNWQELGRADGLAGRTAPRPEALRSACRGPSAAADMAAYARGRAEGLHAYCTGVNGLAVGRGGGRYENTCPPESEQAFLKGYRVGRQMFETRQRIDQAKAEMRANAKLLEKPDTSEPRRRELTEQNRRLARELERLDAMLLLQENIAIPGAS